MGIPLENAGANDPPKSLLSEAHRIFAGENNLDKSLDEFVLHYQVDQQQYYLKRLKEYEAMLHLVGVLAGVVGTDEEIEKTRAAFKKAITDYLNSLPTLPEDFEGVPDLGAVIIGGILSLFGADETADSIIEASKTKNRIELELDLKISQMIFDFLSSLWNSLEKWLDEFWETYEKEGLLIAMGRLRIDLEFFAAECAIDIGIGIALTALTGPAGVAMAAAFKSFRFVGMRVGKNVTRVVVKAIPDNAINASPKKLLEIDIDDANIDPEIDKIVDEDNLGGAGSSLEDTAERATPNPDVPNTTLIPYSRGRNTVEVEVDPETGRPSSVTASLKDDFGSSQRGDNATQIGSTGNAGDHGGHLIAHRFMGDVPDEGIVPQAGNLNTGAWKKMENEWAEWINIYGPKNNKDIEIEVFIDIDPPGAVRPDRFDVEYNVYEVHQDGSKTLLKNREATFENQSGESFDRVYFRTDGSIIE